MRCADAFATSKNSYVLQSPRHDRIVMQMNSQDEAERRAAWAGRMKQQPQVPNGYAPPTTGVAESPIELEQRLRREAQELVARVNAERV